MMHNGRYISKEILKRCWFLHHKNTYGSINYAFKLAQSHTPSH